MTDSEKQEALESIALIRGLMDKSRRELQHSGGWLIFLIWGIYSLVGYAGSQVALELTGKHQWEGLWWPFLALIAGALSILVMRRRAVTQSVKFKRMMVRYFLLFWAPFLLLMAALITFCLVLPDFPLKYMVPLILLVVSTGYLVLGFIFNKSILAMGFIGFTGTVITALFFIERAGLILSLLFGLGLIASGLLLSRRAEA